ncbi:MAG: NAD-dependent DNA ligase LigA [Clostridiales bacterium]|jgi:DNA ligase (NAD+)|nr:NAD-dependent DNA ligase LigA [Clostridiales bacterium]
MDEMKNLINLLNEASKAYYQENREIMTDREYDKLYDKLVKLEDETGIVLSNSPTQNVGFEAVENLKKVAHEKELLSLDKTKQPEALRDFLGEHEGILSWKLDGLTVVLKYREGRLFQAVTRGNGQIGEDVTHNARYFKNVPLKIPFNGELTIRGEAVISYEDFEKLNEQLEMAGAEKYKNPRNLCSGTVRQLDSAVSAKRNVTFFAFGIMLAQTEFGDKKSDGLKRLNSLGFVSVDTVSVTASSVEGAVKDFEGKIKDFPFASDGLVLTFNSISHSSKLGQTSKFPKDSIAFKWKDEIRETVLLDVEWNTSRTGLINPVAIFEPVELEGTTVKRASLHNVSIIEDLQLGIGDTIKVYKANMIIPQIAENITKSGNLKLAPLCPACGAESVLRNNDGVKELICENPNCKAQLKNALVHFVSRDAMNIEGFSESTAEKFMEKGFIENYTDIFKLEGHRDEIVNMEGFGEKSYEKLINAIEKSKKVKLYNFIYALGIKHVGLAGAKLLCRHFANNLSAIAAAKFEELSDIEGFGEVISQSVSGYFQNETNMNLINEALKFIEFEKEDLAADAKLKGITFVITGDLEGFENRNELKEFIERLGGKVASSISAKTSFLINNNPASPSSKNKKARELGVQVITENEFNERFS